MSRKYETIRVTTGISTAGNTEGYRRASVKDEMGYFYRGIDPSYNVTALTVALAGWVNKHYAEELGKLARIKIDMEAPSYRSLNEVSFGHPGLYASLAERSRAAYGLYYDTETKLGRIDGRVGSSWLDQVCSDLGLSFDQAELRYVYAMPSVHSHPVTVIFDPDTALQEENA